ncbi:MAG: hypothetical protein ACFFAS_10270 [Promethearchaeota archaeon]
MIRVLIVIVVCMGLFSIPLFSNNIIFTEDPKLVVEDSSIFGRNDLFFDNIDDILSILKNKITDLDDWNSWNVNQVINVLLRDNIPKDSCLLELESILCV